jgi:hypothetical protein
MYEYIVELERWKKITPNYLDKYSKIQNFVKNCEKNCLLKKYDVETERMDCVDKCKMPLVDVERFNLNMSKRLSVDIYDVCISKYDTNSDLVKETTKIKNCVEKLFRENENLLKKETLDRMDDILKFITNN